MSKPVKLEIVIKDINKLSKPAYLSLLLFLALDQRKLKEAKEYFEQLKKEIERPGLLKYCTNTNGERKGGIR